MKNLSIMIRGCKVRSIDMSSGRIVCELDAATAAKVESLQTAILSKVFKDQCSFFTEPDYTFEYVRGSFQPLIENRLITLYMKHERIRKFDRGDMSWKELVIGEEIDIGVRLYGLAYQYFKTWTGRSRIQHQITIILSGSQEAKGA